MSATQDAIETIKAELDRRLAALEGGRLSLKAGQLIEEIESIRRIARDVGLHGLSELAHGLETAMARKDGGLCVLPWLEAMRGLLGYDAANPLAARSWMAVLAQRYRS